LKHLNSQISTIDIEDS